jgi:hypothetical protein
MNTTLILLMFVPILGAVGVRYIWKHEITVLEVAATFVVGAAMMSVVWYTGTNSQTSDIELLNGMVVGKSQDTVSCSHSYDCNCRTVTSGSGKNKTTSRRCDTCYEHAHDYDWNVATSVGKITIPRVDRQGIHTPARWNQVMIGEPASVEHSYTNYLKAVPDNIFNSSLIMADESQSVPAYPGVYDYYRVNHVINVNSKISLAEVNQLNARLNQTLAAIGGAKQVNINVLFTRYESESYRYAVEKAWLGGKKNDVTIIVGSPNWPEIEWVEVITWVHNSGNDKLRVELQDDILDLKTYDFEKFAAIVQNNVTRSFVRPKNSDYEYLASSIEPPTWVIILAIILSLAASVGIGYYFSQNQYRD